MNDSKPAAEPQPCPLPELATVPCDDCDKYKDDDALSDNRTEPRRTVRCLFVLVFLLHKTCADVCFHSFQLAAKMSSI